MSSKQSCMIQKYPGVGFLGDVRDLEVNGRLRVRPDRVTVS